MLKGATKLLMTNYIGFCQPFEANENEAQQVYIVLFNLTERY